MEIDYRRPSEEIYGFRHRQTLIGRILDARFHLLNGFSDKDVARTDTSHPFFHRSKPQKLRMMKDILMTYVMYDFDLGK